MPKAKFTPDEIERLCDQFEEANKNGRYRCRICKRPDLRDIHRKMLAGKPYTNRKTQTNAERWHFKHHKANHLYPLVGLFSENEAISVPAVLKQNFPISQNMYSRYLWCLQQYLAVRHIAADKIKLDDPDGPRLLIQAVDRIKDTVKAMEPWYKNGQRNQNTGAGDVHLTSEQLEEMAKARDTLRKMREKDERNRRGIEATARSVGEGTPIEEAPEDPAPTTGGSEQPGI